MNRRISTRSAGAALVAVLLVALTAAGCRGTTEPEDGSVLVINRASEPWLVLAIAVPRQEPLPDPNPRFAVAGDDARVIEAGGSRWFSSEELWGFRRGQHGVALFLYAVREGEAVLEEIRTVSASELRNNSFRIRVP